MTPSSSSPILATNPDKYSPNFAERLDKRTSLARVICARIEAIKMDVGGAEALIHARRSLSYG